MRVQLDHETIKIVFVKEHSEYKYGSFAGKDQLNTHCYVYRIFPDEKDRDRTLVGKGSACLNHKDSYDKVKGKKLALTRALEMTLWEFLTKERRTIIWDHFKKAFNIDRPDPSDNQSESGGTFTAEDAHHGLTGK